MFAPKDLCIPTFMHSAGSTSCSLVITPRCRTSDDPTAPATDNLVIDTAIPMSIVTEGMHILVHKLSV